MESQDRWIHIRESAARELDSLCRSKAHLEVAFDSAIESRNEKVAKQAARKLEEINQEIAVLEHGKIRLEREARECEIADEAIATVWQKVMGAFSTSESPSAAIKQPDATEPGSVHDGDDNGLSADGRTLHWGGEAYPIGPGAVGVIGLLVDAYRTGKPYLSQAYLMTEAGCETEIRTLVKNNGLQSVLIRQKGPDGKGVKGMWGLVDPGNIKKKTSTR